MNRLTKRDGYGNADIIGVDCVDFQLPLDFDEFNKVTDALNRLAAYEDTGMEIEEVKTLQQEIDRLNESLSQMGQILADYKGLCGIGKKQVVRLRMYKYTGGEGNERSTVEIGFM